MTSVRVLDSRGRERRLRLGEVAPAGWFRLEMDQEELRNVPVLLTEDATVVAEAAEGNPYDDDESDRVELVLRTASEQAAIDSAAAVKVAGEAEAARLTALIRAAGLPGAVKWGANLPGEPDRLQFRSRDVRDEAHALELARQAQASDARTDAEWAAWVAAHPDYEPADPGSGWGRHAED